MTTIPQQMAGSTQGRESLGDAIEASILECLSSPHSEWILQFVVDGKLKLAYGFRLAWIRWCLADEFINFDCIPEERLMEFWDISRYAVRRTVAAATRAGVFQ